MLKPDLGQRERPLPPGQYSACPFCGGRRLKMAIHNVEGEPIQEMIRCISCEAVGPGFSVGVGNAKAAWNVRHAPEGKSVYVAKDLLTDLMAANQKEREEGLDMLSLLGCLEI